MEKLTSLFGSLHHHKNPKLQTPPRSTHQPFPIAERQVASPPSAFWGSRISAPFPTCTPWQNFVLNSGNCHENFHPFLVQALDKSLSICYPTRAVQPGFIFNPFVADLTFGIMEECKSHVVSRFDDLSVTLDFAGKFGVPLVKGSPYITVCVNEGTPVLSTVHGVVGFWANHDRTKHRITLNNGQTWVVYSSYPLPLTRELQSEQTFQGVVRMTVVSGHEEGEEDESLLDRYNACYPIGGQLEFHDNFEVVYNWETQGSGDLLMLCLPHHREIMSRSCTQLLRGITFNSLDGLLEGVVGHKWQLVEDRFHLKWHSTKGIHDSSARAQVIEALEKDVHQLSPISTPNSYFHGKALARAARMALIAEELCLAHLVAKVAEFLRSSITPWFSGEFSGNAFLYDNVWGGLILRDATGDFGFSAYNDHHYHLGYFIYAGAVLAKLDCHWAHKWKPHLYTLVHDYMSMTPHEFPRLRAFDCYSLHSWASGLTEFADGRNQESTSEAVNAYYAAALLGLAYEDFGLVNMASTLCALECRSAQLLWHVSTTSRLYEPEFTKENRVVSVLWSTKRDSGLWFAGAERRDCRLGIQVLPITPITERMFPSTRYVKELVDWTTESINNADVTDAWRGFVYALEAIYNPRAALKKSERLNEHDDGNSYSNLLWWIHTR